MFVCRCLVCFAYCDNQDALNSLTWAMVILVLWTIGAAVLWSAAAIIALVKARRGDYDAVAVAPAVAAEEVSPSPERSANDIE
jgi:hypothetical protein